MSTLQMGIPTYDPSTKPEYDYSRCQKLTLQDVDGLRVVMGDPNNDDSPDVVIERAVDTWRIFVHPDRGDPLCIIEVKEEAARVEDRSGRLLLERVLR